MIGRGMAFHVVAALSLVAAVVVAAAWVRSMKREAHLLSFVKDGERYTLKSKSGQFVMMGSPVGAKEQRTAELAAAARNDDFDWQGGESGFVIGTVRKFTPTWKMWAANWHLWDDISARARERRNSAANLPIWLAAMEDENRFVSAHMMLMFAARERREAYFRRDRNWGLGVSGPRAGKPERVQLYGGDGPNWNPPMVLLRADGSGRKLDLSVREKLRQEWHDVLDRPRWAVFHGWVLLGALVLPLAWIARPRWRPRTWKRWAFNGAALSAALLGIAAAGLWVRSYRVDDRWTFAARPLRTPAGMEGDFELRRQIGSALGEVRLLDWEGPQEDSTKAWGYSRGIVPGFLMTVAEATGEKYLKVPGVEFHSVPAQKLAAAGTGGGIVNLEGLRWIAVSWWLVVAGCAVLPAMWGWGAGVWWWRARRVKRQRGKICRVCGYDMQATPGRCPECGNVEELSRAL